MPTLQRDIKKLFENTVIAARQTAESGAQKALEALAVHHHEPWGHLTPDQRLLRNQLRAHGRQLGDERDNKRGTQSISRLVTECAFEHWQRMLFTKFLAETDLLIEPQTQVPVSLKDCEELAHHSNTDWLSVATSFAEQMLPQIFRADNPVLKIPMPTETSSKLEELVDVLPKAVFEADDSLGWAYQFWQSEKKDEINNSENKIGPEEISAVTQLFTEDYMVEFLLDNSLGAWWASKCLANTDLTAAQSEDELRKRVSLPGVSFEYLRFIRSSDGHWDIAGGGFESWPNELSDLKILDPCCGSGHFLVGALLKLVPMRMHIEKLSAEEACRLVLSQNLHGLEIDQRCVELAAFALAFAAWRFPGAGGYRQLPEFRLACSGLSVTRSKQEWTELGSAGKMKLALEWMHDVFKQAPILGSLINPIKTDAAKLIDWSELSTALTKATSNESEEVKEAGVAAHGLSKAASLLTGSYHLVITNVPFLGSGKQGPALRDFSERHHSAAKSDLCTVFLERCLDFTVPKGSVSLVIKQDWLFLGSYKDLREKLLKSTSWNLIGRLGEGGFESPAAAGAFTVLLNITNSLPSLMTDKAISAIDASVPRRPPQKAEELRNGLVQVLSQKAQLANPDFRLVLAQIESGTLLSEYADSYLGLGTCDAPHYMRYWWEVPLTQDLWHFIQTAPSAQNPTGGRESVVAWDASRCRVRGLTNAERRQGHNQDYRGRSAWKKKGVSVALIRNLRTTPYFGELFDKSVAVLIPKKPEFLPAISAFCKSPEFAANVRKLDQKVMVTNSTLTKVVFDIERWQLIATTEGDTTGNEICEDATQWTFHGNPAKSATPLQVATSRLLGYRFPAEFLEQIPLSDEAKLIANACSSLDHLSDDDGIVCLSSLHGEPAAADRLNSILAAAYGLTWSANKLQDLLGSAGFKNQTLHDWLRDGFFEEHCGLYHHPFIWHIWDGLLDGFHALVNYHHLVAPNGAGKRTLQKLIYTYLGDWLDRQRSDQRNGLEGADARVAAAENLKEQLEQILLGEPPFDIFVRWKPLQQQPVGWEPDAHDGIRINIRPFMSATLTNSQGGIFRVPPRLIGWGKDKGKDPQEDRSKDDYPWSYGSDGKATDFMGSQSYDGNRWNGLHYSTEIKLSARRAKSATSAEVTV